MTGWRNEVCLTGCLLERDELRYTPAGLPVVNFTLVHASHKMEAGLTRRVQCEVQALAIGPTSRLIAAARLNSEMTVTGFLAARSAKSKKPVLHVTEIEFAEGADHGIQTQT